MSQRAMSQRVILIAALVWAVIAHAVPAFADDSSGVSPNRLKLPKGPGSLEGLGENAEPDMNMGLMSYGVPIAVPAGYDGMTPSLRIVYSSGAGSSAVGLGWALPIPSIERMTSQGLPRYVPEDRFAADAGQELVRVPGSDVFRARFEGGFIRYQWVDESGDGSAGYWRVEYPDGRIGYFGARSDGSLAPEARVGGPDGVFRYHLSELVDVLGHRVVYEYVKDGAFSLPSRISYVFEGAAPRYEVLFSYSARPDVLSDGKPGFELRCAQRLAGVQVRARGQDLRSYRLEYDAASPGLSRLASVLQYGIGGAGPYPVRFEFGYSGSLGEACAEGMCNQPTLVEMGGTLAVDFRSLTADLVDLNGDALPDVVDTAGPSHRVFLNALETGSHRFADAVESSTGTTNLSSRAVQLFDLDGNGFADMVDAASQSVLSNGGTGDWDAARVPDGLAFPDFSADANLRFLDVDNDKRIDVVHSDQGSTFYWMNRGGSRFELEDTAAALGSGFVEDALQLADMNGDGLQDVVQVAGGSVAYRMNFGLGRFSDWIEMADPPLVPDAELRIWDLNGDGLADAVHVAGIEVTFALNRNGRSFETPPTVLAGSSALPIPEVTSEVSLRFADMNGSGSTDVVWLSSAGAARYLELFPHRPNLLTRIDNGVGKRIEVRYGSSTEHMRRDGGADAWTYRLPSPMLTVDEIVSYDTLTQTRASKTFRYHNGYFDAIEQQFRGFIDVDVSVEGDAATEAGEQSLHFDVGQTDPYLKGLLLSQASFSAERPLQTVDSDYRDCEVGGVPEGIVPAVRFVCKDQTRIAVREGAAASQWVVIQEDYDYDAYGNQIELSRHGVTSVGAAGCGACERGEGSFGMPCGAACLGDESFEATSFVAPDATGGRWILHKPALKRRSGVQDGIAAEERYHYDGEPFEGLPVGELSLGLESRIEARVDAAGGRTINVQRLRRDAHGAVVEALDPNGHARRFAYDGASLLVLGEAIVFDDPGHAPYTLTRQAAYHPLLDAMVRVSEWQLDTGLAAPATEFAYDVFGRLVATARPGDTLDVPTETYRYELADPISRIVRQARSRSGGEQDIEDVTCFDGLGRQLQTRQRIDASSYQVSGYTVFNHQGKEARTYDAYVAASGDCDVSAPFQLVFDQMTYDASGRVLSVRHPDDAVYGTASHAETRYEPLRIVSLDEEDTAPDSEHAGTPTITWMDGLGRTVAHDRYLAPSSPVRLAFTYDALGNLRGYLDAKGNEKVQSYDLLGRVVRVEDPDSGTTVFELDDAGNPLARTDARGSTTRFLYDEANRPLREWNPGDEANTLVEYGYDRLPECERCTLLEGRLAQVSFPFSGERRGVDRYGYDGRGRNTYQARQLEGQLYESSNAFDNADRVITTRYPGEQEIRYEFDGLGRIIAIPGYVSRLGYEARGLLQSLQFANGVVTQHTYDVLARLARIDTKSAADEPLQAYRYRRDRVGNISSIEDQSAAGDQASLNAEYSYDAWYRLASADLDPQSQRRRELVRFSYDEIDNLSSQTSSSGGAGPEETSEYVYGTGAGPHAATRVGEQDLAYDPAGNLVARGLDQFDWDHAGRLRRLRRDGKSVSEFLYGPGRDRVRKSEAGQTTDYVSPDFEVRDGVPTAYVRVGGLRVAKLELAGHSSDLEDLAPITAQGDSITSAPDSAITAADAWVSAALKAGTFWTGDDQEHTDPSRLLAASARRLVVGAETKVTFLHHDHLGSTVLSTDESGAAVQHSTQYPFGSPRSTEFYREDYSFTGSEYDAAVEGSYHGARYLLSGVGRWASPDPAFLVLEKPGVEGANPYCYVLNRPTGARDTTGTQAEPGDEVVQEAAAARGWLAHGTAETFVEIKPYAEGVAQLHPLVAASVAATGEQATGGKASRTDRALAVASLALGTVVAGGSKVLGKLGGALGRLVANVGGRPSRALGRALEAAGKAPQPAGTAAHHIVAHGDWRAGPAQKVLERFGIGINSAENGVFLKQRVHGPINSQRYHDAVNGTVGLATTRAEALKALNDMRGILSKGGFE